MFFDKLDGERENEKQRLKKYLTHILKMYVVWCIIWIPWKALHFLSVGVTLEGVSDYIRDIIFVSGGDALWYLPALILSITVVYYLYIHIQSPKIVIAISTIPYIIGVAISSWYGVFDDNAVIDWYYKIFVTVDNGLMYGVMFTSLGMYIAKAEPPVNRNRDITLCVISFFVLVAEVLVINKMGYNRGGECNLISLPIAIWYLFKVVLSITLNNKRVYAKLRDYSTLIYLSHCFIIRTLKLMFAVIDINIGNIVLFILTFVLAFVFAVIVRYFAKERGLKFFKLLY